MLHTLNQMRWSLHAFRNNIEVQTLDDMLPKSRIIKFNGQGFI